MLKFSRIIFFTALLLGVHNTLQAQETGDEWEAFEEWEEETATPALVTGFVEFAAGTRLQTDPAISANKTLREVRGRAEYQHAFSNSQLKLTSDIVLNDVTDEIQLNIRELFWQGNLAFLGSWGNKIDVKTGQQVLTWGTGDYVFLNDLFPKDYQSFFNGREDEFLKAPSLNVKLSGYFALFNFDLVVTPTFEPDEGITGEYFSFFSPQAGHNVAPAFTVIDDNTPDESEFALRLFKTIDTTELALYGYHGYHKTPTAADKNGLPRYSQLRVIGASVVRPLAGGLVKAEYAFHDSLEDSIGNNPRVPNAQSRYLLGFERELIANLTGGLQWYVEQTHDYKNLISHSFWPEFEPEEFRKVITTQLMYRAMRQTLTLNWFNFHSTSDNDGFSRFRATYSPVNEWSLSGGINVFYGDEKYTFFGQFEDATNAFLNFRYFY